MEKYTKVDLGMKDTIAVKNVLFMLIRLRLG